MDESTEKRIIAFTSQSLKQCGIRAVRMNDIAKHMNVSKRTLYEVYVTKENLISNCLMTYKDRTENMFRIIRYECPDAIGNLWAIAKAYIDNLYKANNVFWFDVSQSPEYKFIYDSYNRIWSNELEAVIQTCKKEGYIIYNLNSATFIECFTTLLYISRVRECFPALLLNSAYYMIRGIITEAGTELFNQIQLEE